MDFENLLKKNFPFFFSTNSESCKNLDVYSNFKLPIQYLDDNNLYTLNDSICSDLELRNCDIDNSFNNIDSSLNDIDISLNSYNTDTMYDHLILPSNPFQKNIINKSNKYYTDNILFLQQTQDVIKNISNTNSSLISIEQCDDFMDIWSETKLNNFFLEKYSYIDWQTFRKFNESSGFLQFISFINMSSPVLSFIVPVLLLLFPFIILKIKGIPITFDVYFTLLSQIAKNHFIGKILNIKNFDVSTFVYLLFTIGLYCLQIYQNINQCYKFYQNINNINNYLFNIKDYLANSINNMNIFYNNYNHLSHYNNFCIDVKKNSDLLNDKLYKQLLCIQKFQPSLYKISEIGYLLKMFYIFHSDIEIENSIKYSVGFNGYLNNIHNIHKNILSGNISFTSFNKKNKTSFKKQYYPSLVNQKHIKNDFNINKNIVTGPNASGKTTILKTTALNIIFSQQYGVGFFESANLHPYSFIHSYLNIPDTSGRDSLFQAESRRCKEIIDYIQNNPNHRHFTIFDELFSGTNPKEATKSAYAFLLYLSKFNNVDFILTTHYVSICKRLKNSCKNYKMDVTFNDHKINYTYKIKKGISRIEGATLILEEMKYPCEIIDSIKKY